MLIWKVMWNIGCNMIHVLGSSDLDTYDCDAIDKSNDIANSFLLKVIEPWNEVTVRTSYGVLEIFSLTNYALIFWDLLGVCSSSLQAKVFGPIYQKIKKAKVFGSMGRI